MPQAEAAAHQLEPPFGLKGGSPLLPLNTPMGRSPESRKARPEQPETVRPAYRKEGMGEACGVSEQKTFEYRQDLPDAVLFQGNGLVVEQPPRTKQSAQLLDLHP